MDINSSTLSFRITLIDLDDLRPHEEIIESLVVELANEIRVQNEVRDPLIVDKHALVILDGMHRYSALRKIGCQRAPACLVDYDDERIKVGAWFRFLTVSDPDSVAAEALEAHHLKYQRKAVSFNQTDLVNTAIITQDSAFELTDVTDRLSRSQWAVRIEKYMTERGFTVEYAPDNVVNQYIRSNANIIIPVPIFSKTEIRETSMSGRLLPHKVTRHVIPSRPLKLDVPLDFLIGHSHEKANEKLDQLLSSRHVDRKPPGSVVDGRRYQEELLVFEG